MNNTLSEQVSMDFELFKKTKNGDREARNKIIEQNIGLVVSVAVKFITHYGSIELEDLVHEGIIGLITAVDKFDYTKGYRFSTYASYFIKQKIQRYIQKQTKWLDFSSSLSLNQPVNSMEEDGEEIIDLIPDTGAEEVDRDIIQKELKYFLEEALRNLPEREREILKMRYFSDRKMTLSEAGSILGITKQHAQKIEKRALQKLRNNKKIKKTLADFLDQN